MQLGAFLGNFPETLQSTTKLDVAIDHVSSLADKNERCCSLLHIVKAVGRDVSSRWTDDDGSFVW